MCDTLAALLADGALFAKNSDRPPGEVQVVEAHPRRAGGGRLRTQYLTLDDPGAAALVGSRPVWLWGLEHGVNEHRVAIGNERVWTRDDPAACPPALIGMDLVRLGLERARTADEALDVMTALLERHGQGGVADLEHDEAYFSSFLVVDPGAAWVLETSGRTWAARPVTGSAAISNRLTLRTDWTRSSADVPAGADFDEWRDPAEPTGHADRRLAASEACLAAGCLDPAALAGHLRRHEGPPWGAPGARAEPDPPPPAVEPDFTGVTVCMHVRGYMATAAGMVAELPRDPDRPVRAWAAVGNPCVSVFVPVRVPDAVPAALAGAALWAGLAELRAWVEADPDALAVVRGVLDPLEDALWERAAGPAVEDDAGWARFCQDAGARLVAAVDELVARYRASRRTTA